MATAFDDRQTSLTRPHEDAGMAFAMAVAMAAVLVGGFSLNLALGRSSFAVPAIYHIHGVTFFAWTALFVTQTRLAASGAMALHRGLGRIAALIVPLLVVLGAAMAMTSLRRTGGPFFFDQNEFLWGNSLQLLCFAALVGFAIRWRRDTAWHYRLMLTGMAMLTGPGFGRLLPMPLFMPWAWWVGSLVPMIFPLIGMAIDRRRRGSVHPAWLWGVGAVLVVHMLSMAIAHSAFGIAATQALVEGTPGAARGIAAYFPPAMP